MSRIWKVSLLCLLLVAFLLPMAVTAQAKTEEFTFTSVDGKKVSTKNAAGKHTLLIYEHMSEMHGDPGKLIRELVSAEWIGNPNLSVVVVDFGDKTAQELKQFVASYTNGNKDITFCTNKEGNLYDILMAAANGNAFSLPMGVLFGPDGQVIGSTMGDASEKAFRNLMAGHVPGVEAVPTANFSITGNNGYADAFRIVELINIERKKEGLSEVKMDKGLLEAAMLRAAECSIYYSHTRPDGSRCFTAFPSTNGSSGENIAIGQRSPEEVMEAWMNSPGHRANIMSDSFNSVGVGVFDQGGVHSWVQLFSSETAATVTKPADTKKAMNIKIQLEHLVPRADRAMLTLKKNETKPVMFGFKNKEFDFTTVYPDTAALSFVSSDPKIATVDSKGVVKGVADGTAQITVTLKGTDRKAVVTIVVSKHSYDEWQYNAPTCSEPGSARYHCLECDEWLDMEITALAAHSWDGGKTTQKPTTEKAGQRLYTCENCGKTKTESIPKYSAPKPAPTQPATAAPTEPATKGPTATPTVPPTAALTAPATKAPTAPVTAAPTAPLATEQSVPTTQIATLATEPVLPIPEPTEMPSQQLPADLTEGATEPVESSPEVVPETQPTQAKTQPTAVPETQPETQPAQEENPPVAKKNDKLAVAIIVVVAAVIAAGSFLIFWKRKNK